MLLTNVMIHKYKSFVSDQSIDVNEDVTILVGMNESGKTAALESIAKTNYFQADEDFQFNLTHDYPRKEKKKIDKSGKDPSAVTCTYKLSTDEIQNLSEEFGEKVLENDEFSVSYRYGAKAASWNGPKTNTRNLIREKLKQLKIHSESLEGRLLEAKTSQDFSEIRSSYKEEKYLAGLNELAKYFENKWGWDDPVREFVARTIIKPLIPKFLYYDEYFSLPSRISIEKLKNGQLDGSEFKTAQALIDLADIDIVELVEADEFEDFIAELEATEAIISEELFKYWKSNTNLQITFQLDKIERSTPPKGNSIVEHVLDIRVKSKGVSLPLKNRSKGFNWFFSFLVWFKRIQEDPNTKYVLLLDEPGLNLHASAQADLLEFIEDLSEEYQIIYSTHSPFMIPPHQLNRVRTIVEKSDGSVVSTGIQEKDPNTLFPLQAALGYDIAQNLFVSKNNLLIEGVSDLIFLTALSSILESDGRQGKRDDVTLVPTGGLDKVGTFISLLRGSQLNIACLLDSPTSGKGTQKLNDLVAGKVINKSKIKYFDEFVETHNKADIEDLFEKSEYLELFNSAFSEHPDLEESDLNGNIERIVIQINSALSLDRFNHYRPANELLKRSWGQQKFSDSTLDRFEKMFQIINGLFD